MADTRPAVDWLLDGARSAPRAEMVLEELCRRLVQGGIPLWRVAVYVRTLHPEVMGRSFVWQPGAEVKIAEAPFRIMDTDEYRQSPVVAVVRDSKSLRRKLADPACVLDYAVLAEFRADGMTDYLATPLIFTDGAAHAATWTTSQPGGFTDEQVAGIESIVPALTRVAEIRALRRTATNLLDTYVGHSAGERILAGAIRRGHTEAIHSVVWLSDMRGFTSMADRMPPGELVELLNNYFDCQVPAIEKHGGEVLKFIGDGLLAIFPIAEAADTDTVCERALAAARQAQVNVDALDAAEGFEYVERLRFGLALHLGEVMYGNIGSGNRLDFTCIGPAVNLAARLEKVAARQGRTIILSAEFAQHCRDKLEPLGELTIAGFAAPHAAFGLPAAAL